jgi:hypothetical protein
MEQEIQRRVVKITKLNQDRLTQESGIQSSLTEDDMKEYLQQALREIEYKRKQGQ